MVNGEIVDELTTGAVFSAQATTLNVNSVSAPVRRVNTITTLTLKLTPIQPLVADGGIEVIFPIEMKVEARTNAQC